MSTFVDPAPQEEPLPSVAQYEATHQAELDFVMSRCEVISHSPDPIVLSELMLLSGRVTSLLSDIQDVHWALHARGESHIYSEAWCQRVEEGILQAMYKSTLQSNILFLSNNHFGFWKSAKRIRQVYRLVFGSYRYSGCVTFNEVYAGALTASLVAATGGDDIPAFFKRVAHDTVNLLRDAHSIDVENLHALFAILDASLFVRHKDAMIKGILRDGPRPESFSATIPVQYVAIASELQYEHALIAAAEGCYTGSFERLRDLKCRWLDPCKHDMLSDTTIGMPHFTRTLVPEHLVELCMCFDFTPATIQSELTAALKAHVFKSTVVSNGIVEELRAWFEQLTSTMSAVTSGDRVTRPVAAALLQGCHDGVKASVLANFGDSFSTFLATQMGSFIRSRNAAHFQSYAKMLVFLTNTKRFTDEYERRLLDRLLLHPTMHLTAERKGVAEIVQFLGHHPMCRSAALLRVAGQGKLQADIPVSADTTAPSDAAITPAARSLLVLPGLLVVDPSLPRSVVTSLLTSSPLGVAASQVLSLCTTKHNPSSETPWMVDGALTTAEVEVNFAAPEGAAVSASLFGCLPQLAVVMALDPTKPPRPTDEVRKELGIPEDVMAVITKSLGNVITVSEGRLLSLNLNHLMLNRKAILPRIFR